MIKVRMNQLCVVFKLILTLTSPSSVLMTTFPIMLSGQTRGNSSLAALTDDSPVSESPRLVISVVGPLPWRRHVSVVLRVMKV